MSWMDAEYLMFASDKPRAASCWSRYASVVAVTAPNNILDAAAAATAPAATPAAAVILLIIASSELPIPSSVFVAWSSARMMIRFSLFMEASLMLSG